MKPLAVIAGTVLLLVSAGCKPVMENAANVDAEPGHAAGRPAVDAAARQRKQPPLAQSYPVPRAWGRPLFTETFSGDRVDPRRWAVYDTPTGENPRTRRAVRVSDGQLHLTGAKYDGKVLSGGIASHEAFTYGRFEVRMRADRGAGFAPVLLLWPTVQGKPEWAEINFAEIPDPTRLSTGLFTHKGNPEKVASRTVYRDFTEWHVFALEWLPTRLTYYIDGRRVWNYTGPLIPQKADMHLALQNDVVCYTRIQCRTPATPTRVTMHIDWARAWKVPT
ncbi:glycoside hydrolase family 16 protein [Actinocorallia sp. A-T 12471]|uniref:glycoside hydrolase family 16 protein n=1 Tax=Actinocorallia sp. A-T 12471 TaxID=3089813 RepID=UPI0029D12D90|nr:glycoside hydrolase family 16 protein [Actinocorallia sp. A-T 12471]MDX6738571.1 glycoside hydrolase family 16 protein [Actinocorallia sp. A-T 12471]